jgi:hypothetical protein
VPQVDDAAEFIIDETFQVPGVGVVVAGTVKRGTLVQGASLLLGPHAGDAAFKPTAIKSIAYKRLPVTKARRPCSPSCMRCASVPLPCAPIPLAHALRLRAPRAALLTPRMYALRLRAASLVAQAPMIILRPSQPPGVLT